MDVPSALSLIHIYQKMNEKEQEAVLSEEQTRRKEADSLKNYLQKNLSKTQYTYLFNQNGVLEIGVPSAKYISRAKELCTKYTEQTKQDVTCLLYTSRCV